MTVYAQSVDGALRDLSNTSHNEFAPAGEIELRGARAILKPEDWALARPFLDGPPRRQRWVSQSAKRLLPFDDLSDLYVPESARRLLVESGLQDGFVGEKAFRIGCDDMIVVTMVRSEDGRCRATAKDMSRLSLFHFNPAKVLVIPTPSGAVSLMEKGAAAETGVVNWTSDAQYVERIVRSALEAENEEERATAAVATTLLAHADKLAGQLSIGGEPDPKIAHEILRSRRLGELLWSRPALVSEFMAALRRAPDISARIEEEIVRLTTEAVDARRAELTSELTASLEAEFANVRRERTSKLEAELADLEASSLQELQEKFDSKRSAALSAIEVMKSGLERAVAELEKTRDALHESHRLKMEEMDALSADIARLALEAADRKADVDRLLRIEQVLRGEGDRLTKAGKGPLFPLTKASLTARPLPVGDIPEWLRKAPLLTDAGRRGVARLAALILSGGVPVVDGPEADDVLHVLSLMLAGGAVTTFDCDPTVISYEDLWRRPGGDTLTALGLALSDVQETAAVRLCAIRRSELSPSQFWIETLRCAGKQRLLPKEFLLCVTRASDRANEASNDWSFRAEGWIERNAGAEALASVGDENFRRVAEVSNLPFDPPAALSVIGAAAARFSIADALWLAQFVPVAKAVLKGEAGPFVKEVLETVSAEPKPNLKLIDNRGP
jgi:hypothetical protein